MALTHLISFRNYAQYISSHCFLIICIKIMLQLGQVLFLTQKINVSAILDAIFDFSERHHLCQFLQTVRETTKKCVMYGIACPCYSLKQWDSELRVTLPLRDENDRPDREPMSACQTQTMGQLQFFQSITCGRRTDHRKMASPTHKATHRHSLTHAHTQFIWYVLFQFLPS